MAAPIEVRNDVVFGRGGGRDLLADLYRPSEIAEPAPAILLLHGGGWRGGHRSMLESFGTKFAQAGFVAVASEYRLHGEALWPAHIHDAKAAIRWIRASATELAIDPERIAILGRSAGGHLALLAAGTPGMPEFEGDGGHAGVDSSVAAAIGIFPPTSFFVGDDRVHGGTPARALLLEHETENAARRASPLAHVSPDYPPTFLLHGTADRVVPPSASMAMYDALVAAGVLVEMHMYAGQPHGFVSASEMTDLVTAEIIDFLRRCLAPAAESDRELAATN